MTRSWKKRIATLLLILSMMAPMQAEAISKNVRTVWITGFYGILGGGVMGLVAWPMVGSHRSFFMGMSIGLYLGITVGFFHISNSDSPGNPLVTQSMGQSMGRKFGSQEPRWLLTHRIGFENSMNLDAPNRGKNQIYFEFPVKRF